MHRLTPCLAAVALCALACNSPTPNTAGSAHFRVTTSGNDTLAQRITRVTITLTAPDLPTTSFNLTQTGGPGTPFSGEHDGIRAGTGRVFSAVAADDQNVTLFSGVSAPTTIVQGMTAHVDIQLQVVASQVPNGSIPIIDSITLSADDITPSTQVYLSAVAHDPIASQTASLVYAWTQTGVLGGFDSMSSTHPTWTSPGGVTTPVTTTLTLTVTNAQQQSTSLSVVVTTELAPYSGNATIDATFGPQVSDVTAVPGYLAPGTPTVLTAIASDGSSPSDLVYAWVSTCTSGSFDTLSEAQVQFTPSAVDGPSCTFVVTATGPTGVGTGALTLGYAPVNPIHVAPQIDAVNASVQYIIGPTEVTLHAYAHSESGSALTFHWVHSTGEFPLGSQVDTQGTLGDPESTSTITWKLGGCTFDAQLQPLVVDVQATDADGNVADAGLTMGQKCDPQWAMAGHDAQRTSHTDVIGPQVQPVMQLNGTFTHLQHYQFGPEVTGIGCSVVGGDGIVYSQLTSTSVPSVQSLPGTTINAFDPMAGVEKWRFVTPPSLAADGPFQELGCPVLDATGLVYANRQVYNGAGGGTGFTESLIAIDARTGTLAWNVPLGDIDTFAFATLVVGTDSTVYVPSVLGRKTYAVRGNTDRTSGAKVWTFPPTNATTNRQNLSAISPGGETLYVTTDEDEGGLADPGAPDSLYALSTVDGSVLSEVDLSTGTGLTWGSLAVAAGDGVVWTITTNRNTGSEGSTVQRRPGVSDVTPIWATNYSGTFLTAFFHEPAINNGGNFYASSDGFVKRIDPALGAVTELTETGYVTNSLPILDGANTFYQVLIDANNDGNGIVDASSHASHLWSIMAGPGCTPAAMTTDGQLVVPCTQGGNTASLNFVTP